MIALLAGLALQTAAAAAPPGSLESALRVRDQTLLNALVSGDRAIWDAALTPDAVYIDENGTVFTRAQYLKSLEPLPANISGHIDIADYQLHLDGDTALVIHKDDEFEDFHGHSLKANYLMSETWVRRNGEWKLALVHVYVVAKDPPEITVAPAQLDEYVGRYSAGPDLTWTIHRDGNLLLGGHDGKTPLKLEAPDVLFVPGQPRERRFFQRAADGKVSGFTWRREGEEIHYQRLP
jgi:ketosteroid isomerase-like protein